MGVFSCLLNVCVTVQKRLSTPSSCHPFLVRWEIYHLQKRRSIDLRDIIKRANLMGDEWCTAMAEEPPKIKAEFQAGVHRSVKLFANIYHVFGSYATYYSLMQNNMRTHLNKSIPNFISSIFFSSIITKLNLSDGASISFFWSDYSLAATC